MKVTGHVYVVIDFASVSTFVDEILVLFRHC